MPNPEPLCPLSCASWPSDTVELSNKGRGGRCGGGSRVEGILSCLLRGIFTNFCARCTLTFLSTIAPVGSRHQTPYSVSLFLFSPVGVSIIIQHSTVLCTIESHLGCISNWHTSYFFHFFYGRTPDRYSGQRFIAPSCVCLGRGFVEPRPPAGITEDNSRAFRWVFHWLLSPRKSHNIIGTVHFLPASLLCPIVTQSGCRSTSSFFFLFSLWFEACLSFVIALHSHPVFLKRSIFFLHLLWPFCK